MEKERTQCWKDDPFAPAPCKDIVDFLERLRANHNICIFPEERRDEIREEEERRYAEQKAARK